MHIHVGTIKKIHLAEGRWTGKEEEEEEEEREREREREREKREKHKPTCPRDRNTSLSSMHCAPWISHCIQCTSELESSWRPSAPLRKRRASAPSSSARRWCWDRFGDPACSLPTQTAHLDKNVELRAPTVGIVVVGEEEKEHKNWRNEGG